MDWFLWAAGADGLLSNPRDMRPVHHDAAVVHEAVMALDRGTAWDKFIERGIPGPSGRLLIDSAETGDWPERPVGADAEPRAVPVEPPSRTEDYGWYMAAGTDGREERRDYWIRSAETLVYDEEEWQVVGRKKMRRGRTKRVRVEVQYCPIAWSPDPDRIAMSVALADRWDAALDRLRQALAGAELRAHVLG